MGLKERRARERAALRRSILDSTRDLAAREGWQAVTMNKVAAAIEYSKPAIYALYDSKDSLLRAVADEGFGELRVAVHEARACTPDPPRQLIAMAGAYIDFAAEQPELYAVMHTLGAAFFTPAPLAQAHAALGEVREVLEAINQAHDGRHRETKDTAVMIRTALHGIAALALNDQLPGGWPYARQLAVGSAAALAGLPAPALPDGQLDVAGVTDDVP